MRQNLYLIIILTLISCRQNATTSNRIEKNNRSPFRDLNNEADGFISLPCAVLIRPDSNKVANLKKEGPEEDFYTIADDNEYYMSISIKYLDSIKLKKIEKFSKGLLAFRTSSGEKFEMNLDSLYWGIILFNGKAKPIKTDMTDINTDYQSYMKK